MQRDVSVSDISFAINHNVKVLVGPLCQIFCCEKYLCRKYVRDLYFRNVCQ